MSAEWAARSQLFSTISLSVSSPGLYCVTRMFFSSWLVWGVVVASWVVFMGFIRSFLSSLLDFIALVSIKGSGYLLSRKYPAQTLACLSKSSMELHIVLIHKNWLYGIASLHCRGWAEE